ncbi:MAG: peptidase S8, partial [Lachnospiraceae bacterium]|nr:peptidase S8 [Lachnospiraceae bacterium]
MENIKIDQALQLALELPEAERAESAFLNYGFETGTDSLQIIVRHTGSILSLEEELPFTQVTELLNGYAIITTRQENIEQISLRPEIIYIEKPKKLFFHLQDSRTASCLTGVQKSRYSTEIDSSTDYGLSGFGTMIGIIDSGIDYRHPAFLSEDGESRIAFLWNQAADREESYGRIPAGYGFGAQYTKDTITAALSDDTLIPDMDTGSGHGTAV